MYNSGGGANGGHSYSTPSSPNTYYGPQGGSGGVGDGKAGGDKELAALFRAAAANVTQLYKEASSIGQSAYKAGYEECYSDIWEFVLAAQADGGPQQQQQTHAVLQQLAEFARAKRLAPRQPQHTPGHEPHRQGAGMHGAHHHLL
ncbi:hypothetical protein H4R18_001911 [Coemansia javaensis]|uniref:Uncharacterized protein n=1 Tax=Coemansia javaensis TaxID=2761396 RepID=A0A9W8LKP5_9FUNG|nr:hypothetical protein H4R18_001911 [Coemansia javaensis]